MVTAYHIITNGGMQCDTSYCIMSGGRQCGTAYCVMSTGMQCGTTHCMYCILYHHQGMQCGYCILHYHWGGLSGMTQPLYIIMEESIASFATTQCVITRVRLYCYGLISPSTCCNTRLLSAGGKHQYYKWVMRVLLFIGISSGGQGVKEPPHQPPQIPYVTKSILLHPCMY